MASDQEIAKGVETLLRQSDPTVVTSLNGVVQQLEAKLGQDLSHKAGFIRDQISHLLRSHPTPTLSPNPNPHKDHFAFQQQHHPQFLAHATPQFAPHFALQQQHLQFAPQDLNFRQPHPLPTSHFQSQAPPQVQPHPPHVKPELLQQNVAPAAPQMPKESVPVIAKRKGGPGGLNKVCCVSPALQAIVGEPALPRTEIVKQLWAYIRKNSLQDPSNKRKIICDDALRVVFETDCTDMFKMNKLLAKHITPLEPSKSVQAKRLKVDAESTTVSTEPTASPVIISEALAKFFGAEGREMLPADAEKRVWEYIKVNHLEDPSNPMVVLCDDKLHELLGCESISVMGIHEMLLRHHLFKNS